MQRDFFHIINLEDNLETSAAIAAALDVTVQSLLGRKFYYKAAARTVYLFENGKYRKAVELTADLPPPGTGNPPTGDSAPVLIVSNTVPADQSRLYLRFELDEDGDVQAEYLGGLP